MRGGAGGGGRKSAGHCCRLGALPEAMKDVVLGDAVLCHREDAMADLPSTLVRPHVAEDIRQKCLRVCRAGEFDRLGGPACQLGLRSEAQSQGC